MIRRAGKYLSLLAFSIVLAALWGAGTGPSLAQSPPGCDPYLDPGDPPYIFLLFDTSGAMNWTPNCSLEEYNQGACDQLHNGPGWTQLRGDDPASRFWQSKETTYVSVRFNPESRWGFATFNQDGLQVRAKHWLYQAAGNGVSLPGWGPFPATGAREVFGLSWRCDTGTGDNEIGCRASSPADLSDPWERGRVQQLPKAGKAGKDTVSFFVRHGGVVYKVRYKPAHGTTLGEPATVTETVERCENAQCGHTSEVGQTDILFHPTSEFLAWDSAPGGSPVRTDPNLSYFPTGATDAEASNTSAGLEPNDDGKADRSKGYNLHWPTVDDPRGPAFSQGDFIPLDWQSSHRDEILRRLAPNLALDPLAEPDFRTSVYFQDSPDEGNVLQLKDPAARPLITVGAAPLGNALRDFRVWWHEWAQTARLQDPGFVCRHRNLVLISAGDEQDAEFTACLEARRLLLEEGVVTWVVSVADPRSAGPLYCIAAQGGTAVPLNLREMVNTLYQFASYVHY